MDIEKIVLKLITDATQYNQQWDLATKKVHESTLKIEQMGKKLGIPTAQIRRDVDAIIREFQRLENAAHAVHIRGAVGKITSAGLTTGATPAQLQALRALQMAHVPPLPGGYRGNARDLLAIQNMNQFRPGVFGEQFRRDRFGGGWMPASGPSGTGPSAIGWDWISSIFGGAVGRGLGGRLGGLGGLAGGGFGGPMGAVAGVAIGTTLHFGFVAAEAAAKGLLFTIEQIGKGILFIVERSITLGMQFEKVRASFEIFTGGPAQGRKMISDIQDVAVRSPYTSRELRPISQLLMGTGVEPTSAVSVLGRLGDLAAGDTERLYRLALAYGQVMAKGRFYAQELRQFTEVGVGVADFAQTMGLSTRQFREAMESDVGVGSDVVRQTVNRLTEEGGRFAGMSERINKTVSGQWSALVERLEMGAERLGMIILGRFNIADWLERIRNALESIDINKIDDWAKRMAKAFEPLITAGQTVGGEGGSILENIFGGATKWQDMQDDIREFAIMIVASFNMINATVKVARHELMMYGRALQALGIVTALPDFLGMDGPGGPTWSQAVRLARMQFGRTERRNADRREMTWLQRVGSYGAIVPPIPGGPGEAGMDPEVARFRDKFFRDQKEGFTPLAKFNNTLDLINRSFGTPGAHGMLGGAAAAMQGMLGRSNNPFTSMLGGAAASMLGIAQGGLASNREQAMFNLFQDMEKSVANRLEVKLPPALAVGSQEAQDTINRSLQEQLSVEERVARVMEEIKTLTVDQNTLMRRVAMAMEASLNIEKGPMPREIEG